MNTGSGFYALHVQEGLSAIARKYFEFYSTKCTTSIEESFSVLGLPLQAAPAPVQSSVNPIVHQAGTIAGIPGAGVEQPAKIPVKRGKRTTKTESPHQNLRASEHPPVPGWCKFKMTKGAREGLYCIKAVNTDDDKGRGEYCISCWFKDDAFGKAGAKSKGKTTGVAPGADLTPGTFATILPTQPRPSYMLKQLAGADGYFYQEETGLIYRSQGDIKVVCGARENGVNIPLNEKYIEIAKKMKAPYITPDGKVWNPQNEPTSVAPPTTFAPNLGGFGASFTQPPPTQSMPMFNANPAPVPVETSSFPPPPVDTTPTIPNFQGFNPPPTNAFNLPPTTTTAPVSASPFNLPPTTTAPVSASPFNLPPMSNPSTSTIPGLGGIASNPFQTLNSSGIPGFNPTSTGFPPINSSFPTSLPIPGQGGESFAAPPANLSSLNQMNNPIDDDSDDEE